MPAQLIQLIAQSSLVVTSSGATMKSTAALLLGLMLCTVSLAAPPATQPAPGVRQGKGGDFGFLLTYTKDKAFFDNWNKPDAPRLSLPSNVKRGETLYTVAIFTGAKPDADGNGKIEMKFKVLRPDGTVYGEGTSIVWDRAVKKAPILELVGTSPTIRIELTDPIGTYTLQITLIDRLADKRVSHDLPFDVVEK
jgi:hypothetical protein